MTWQAGVDLLSFGATKNGCIGAEALVFFDPARAADAPFLRKRAGQLFSKSRFIAAQFDAYFKNELWLRMARHSNAMAQRLRDGFAEASNIREVWPTEGNEVFAVIEERTAERLRSAGATFHGWKPPAGENGLNMTTGETLIRLVASFATRPEDVDAFLGELARSVS
jgi:threonine aldolase